MNVTADMIRQAVKDAVTGAGRDYGALTQRERIIAGVVARRAIDALVRASLRMPNL
jgi:hypothetical protein